MRQAVSRLRRERNQAGAVVAGAKERRAVATVNVTAVERFGGFVAGDRVQRHRAEVPLQARAATPGLQVGEVDAVVGHLVAVEVLDQRVATLLDDVGAEQAGGAIELALVQVEQRFEVIAFVQELHAAGGFVIAFEATVGSADAGVVDPVIAALVDRRDACRPAIGQRAAVGALYVPAVVAAVADADVAIGILRRTRRIELDHAGRGVAAEQRALRTTQHFHVGQVEQREALQQRAFLHHIVVHQRHRLRRIEVEVGVAQAADVKAREGTAVGRLDVEAGHACGQETDVIAGRTEHIQLLALDRGERDRHVLGVLDTALRGHLQGVEGNRILGSGGFLGGCYQRQQGGKSGNEGARDRKSATGSAGRGHGGRLCLEGW